MTASNAFQIKSSQDICALPANAQINAHNGLGYNGKVVVFDNAGGQVHSRTFQNGTWGAASNVGSETLLPLCIFLDSNDNIYCSPKDSGLLYRSSDDGATWSSVLAFTANDDSSGTTDAARSMCEDDEGNIYCNQYAANIGLYKSTDGGLTWTKIILGGNGNGTFPGSGMIVGNAVGGNQHIHAIWWDNYRNVLIACHGDSDGSANQVSEDYGVTWQTWAATNQSVGVAFDADYIYITSDVSGDRSIYRSSKLIGAGASVVVNSSVSLSHDMLAEIQKDDASAVANDAGHCWWGFCNDNGVVHFGYGAAGSASTGADVKALLMATVDQGETWVRVDDSETYAENGNLGVDYMHDPCMASTYSSSWDKQFYSVANGVHDGRLFRTCLFKYGTEISISPVTGVDYTNDGVTSPVKNPIDNGLPFGIKQKLLADNSTESIHCGMSGAFIDKNGFTTTGTDATAPHRLQNCENTFPDDNWTISTNGTMVEQDTAQVKEGSSSVQSVLTSGQFGQVQRVNVFSQSAAAGQETCYSKYWLYLEPYTPAGDMTFMEVSKQGDSIKLFERLDGTIRLDWRMTDTFVSDSDTKKGLPQGRWFPIEIEWFRHATQGYFKAWVDGELTNNLQGVDTQFNVATGGFTVKCGISVAPTGGITYSIDDIKCSYGDPDQATGYVLTGDKQKMIPEGIYT